MMNMNHTSRMCVEVHKFIRQVLAGVELLRRIKAELDKLEIHLAVATVEKLMAKLGVQVSLYNRHRNNQYHSYACYVGTAV